MDSSSFGWSATTAPRPPHRRIHRKRHDEPPRYSAPPNQTAPGSYHPPTKPVTSTSGWVQVDDPQEQASVATVLWSAGETAPRRLDASATTRSLFDGLAIHGEPPQEPQRSTALAGMATSRTSDFRQQTTPSFASASHEQAKGAPQDSQRPRLPAAAFGRSAEVHEDQNCSSTSIVRSNPPGSTESRRHTCSTPATASHERERAGGVQHDPQEPVRPADAYGLSAASPHGTNCHAMVASRSTPLGLAESRNEPDYSMATISYVGWPSTANRRKSPSAPPHWSTRPRAAPSTSGTSRPPPSPPPPTSGQTEHRKTLEDQDSPLPHSADRPRSTKTKAARVR